MRKAIPFLLLVILLAACGKKSQKSACGTQVCTTLFSEVEVQFQDSTGNPVTVKNIIVADERDKNIQLFGVIASTAPGNYDIVDDSDLKLLSADGDDLQVTATDSATNETKQFVLKVQGGPCACHVQRVSGPTVVTFR